MKPWNHKEVLDDPQRIWEPLKTSAVEILILRYLIGFVQVQGPCLTHSKFTTSLQAFLGVRPLILSLGTYCIFIEYNNPLLRLLL